VSFRLLVVEDDAGLARILKDGLTLRGHAVTVKHNAEDALKVVKQSPPDLVILDVGLDGLSGFQMLEIVRRDPATAALPVILLTALHTEKDKLKGLGLGADDYVTKPFSEKELAARVETVLRRARPGAGPEGALIAGALRVDTARREVVAAGRPVELSKLEFDLLVHLLRRPGVVHSHDALMENVWGADRLVSRHTVTVAVSRLKEKLGTPGTGIVSVKDIGYKFQEPA
jgi:DNA-binding response OmpR family regulator